MSLGMSLGTVLFDTFIPDMSLGTVLFDTFIPETDLWGRFRWGRFRAKVYDPPSFPASTTPLHNARLMLLRTQVPGSSSFCSDPK